MNRISTQTKWLLLLTITIGLLAACSAESDADATPILPPPNISVGGADNGETAVPLEPGTVPEDNSTGGETTNPETNPETAGEAPTPTLQPTATPLPSPVAGPTAVTDPPTLAVNPGQLPATSRDLLFIADGAFKRWNHTTRQIETLIPGPDPSTRALTAENSPPYPGDITAYTVTPDGKRAVIAQLTASQIVTRTAQYEGQEYLFTDNDVQYRLYFMDTVSGDIWQIVPRVDNISGFSLSPDAQYLTFIASSLDGANSVDDDGSLKRTVYLMPTGGGNAGAITPVASCASSCSTPTWHPTDPLFVWGDQTAVWLRNISGQEPEILLQNRPFQPDANNVDNIAVYSPIEWASNGRYLLMWRGGWEGGNRAVFDVPTRAVVDVPNTFVYVNTFPAEVMWMPDDRLFVLRSETDSGQFKPMAELWRFQPEQNTIALEESVNLSSQSLGAAGQMHMVNGRFAYALFSEDANNSEAGLYHLTSFNEVPERVNAVPPVPFFPSAALVFWPTDGSGALILSAASWSVYYGPANGEALYDLTAVLGAEPDHFHWQPEIVIP